MSHASSGDGVWLRTACGCQRFLAGSCPTAQVFIDITGGEVFQKDEGGAGQKQDHAGLRVFQYLGERSDQNQKVYVEVATAWTGDRPPPVDRFTRQRIETSLGGGRVIKRF